jgi:alpha-1,2-mannosyltransferase
VFLQRPAALPARVALVTVNLAAITFYLLSFTPHGVGYGPYRIDLDVYRIAGRVWLNGGSLYGHLPRTMHGARLPFTYPPISAIVLSPLALVPMAVAGTVLTLGSIALVCVVLKIFLPRPASPGPAGPSARSLWALAWLLPLALLTEPVRNTLDYGQINVVLLALVCADCLLPAPRWPRGMLVGLAAALKLTPAAFVLFLLLRRDYRAVGTAALSFLAATGAGFLLAWHDSIRYWTHTAFRTGRIGHADYTANQAIQAVLSRADLDPHTAAVVVWAVLAVAVLLVAYAGMRRALDASEDRLALSLNALAALLTSPISWSHHWVWAVPLLMSLADLGHRYHLRLPSAMAVAGFVLFCAAPQWWLPSGKDRELRWAVWQQVVGSSYVLFAAFVLLVAALPSRLYMPPSHGGRQAGAEIALEPGTDQDTDPGTRQGAGLGADPGTDLCADPGTDQDAASCPRPAPAPEP